MNNNLFFYNKKKTENKTWNISMCIRSWCIQNHILWFVFFHIHPISFLYTIFFYITFFLFIYYYICIPTTVFYSLLPIYKKYIRTNAAIQNEKWTKRYLHFPMGARIFYSIQLKKKCIYISYRKGIEPIFHIFLSIVLFSTKLSRYPSLKITHFILMKMRHCQLFKSHSSWWSSIFCVNER